MFRLSRLTDYAIALLTHMVCDDKRVWAASDLASRSRLPQPTVSKILKHLAKSGLIKALRGAAGGYQLSQSPFEISIIQIVEAMDGPISVTDCTGVGREAECLIRDFCVLGGNWSKINHAVRNALASVSLADMAGKNGHSSSIACHPDTIANHACSTIEGAQGDLSSVADSDDELVQQVVI